MVQALLGKGAALGTTLAFMMAVTALSFPEFMILKKVMKPKLIALFAGVVAVGIIFVGDVFNAVMRPPIHHHTKIVPMTNIKILSTGCANCKATQKLVEDVIKAKGVHAGGIPSRAQVEQWIGA